MKRKAANWRIGTRRTVLEADPLHGVRIPWLLMLRRRKVALLPYRRRIA